MFADNSNSVKSRNLEPKDERKLKRSLKRVKNKIIKFKNQTERQNKNYKRKFNKRYLKALYSLCEKNERRAEGLMFSFVNTNRILDEKTRNIFNANYNNIEEKEFDPYLDSLKCIVKYYYKYQLNYKDTKLISLINSSMDEFLNLEKELAIAGVQSQYVRNQKSIINEVFAGVNNRYAKKCKKDAYYYVAKQKECMKLFKNDLIDKSYLTDLAKKSFDFNNFYNSSNELSKVKFDASSWGKSIDLLQTNEFIQKSIDKDVGVFGSKGVDIVKHNLKKSFANVRELKSNLNGLNSVADLPDFKPHPMKAMPLKARLVKSFALQFNSRIYGIPMGADIGYSLGYKIASRIVSGAGFIYKAGLGNDISHLDFCTQGFGGKTFATYAIKRQINMYLGFEKNFYQNVGRENEYLKENFQKISALAGLELLTAKKKNKIFSFQLLYDFLANEYSPKTNPVIFRSQISY